MELGVAMAVPQTTVVWQAEIDRFAQQILGVRFPGSELIRDAREIDEGSPHVDVLTAGFPCQPASLAGRGRGLDDPRWLWPVIESAIRAVRPPLVLLENVPGLLGRGLQDVVAGLIGCGYDAQWDLVSAAVVGAPHLRERLWIVAYPSGTKIGRVFSRPAPVRWPQEPAPRLVRRRERYGTEREMAIGNSVVPQVVESIIRQSARAKPPFVGDTHRFDNVPYRLPRSGMITDGHFAAFESDVPVVKQGRWPTPKASRSGPDFRRHERTGGGDDLVTAIVRADGRGDGNIPNPVWLEWLMGLPAGWTDPSAATDVTSRGRTSSTVVPGHPFAAGTASLS